MSQDRRSFLKSVGAFAAVASTRTVFPALASVPPSSARLRKIGIQLYTVRKAAATDLAGAIAQIGKIGYQEVEFAGYQNQSAADVRRMLDANGLTAPSAHIALEQVETNTAKTFADAHTVGHQWITVPSLPRGPLQTADDWKRLAARFNAAATKAHADGFKFAFHNHNDIVRTQNGVLPIDILMHETNPAVMSYQMDIFWAVSGGANPVALMGTYPGRFKMFHIKDGRPPYTDQSQTDVGQGAIDFKPILGKGAGIEHYFVESDSAADPFGFAKASHDFLAKLDY